MNYYAILELSRERQCEIKIELEAIRMAPPWYAGIAAYVERLLQHLGAAVHAAGVRFSGVRRG
jgi:hypothetical protein